MSFFNSSGFYTGSTPPWREHICGVYYNTTYQGRLQKTYLPQVELQAHATILATTSRTVLTQTFVNPSTEKGIREVRYTFPLYDGVSVVGFTCHVGDRTIVGEVKEKEKARAVFKEAVARGETAGLLEQLPDASDVFTTTVGNIAPGDKLVIKVTYLGELKHDMEVDGTRFTIPNIICPRYGNYSGEIRTTAAHATGGGISITVDAEMADDSFIQRLQSPTHPISMTMGTTSLAPDAEPTMTKASATLTLGTAELDKDFVLQIIAKNTGIPKAVVECHPSIPNHRALMATLVPKFALPPEKPELVFVCDRSGSMAGSNITLVIHALKVFLKSLPVGVKFNICSFGSSYSFLWEKSVTYSQQTLDEAVRHADTFSANYGGTEMLIPLRETIERRYKDMPLDVMLLTDGEIWNQQDLFDYLNQSITESKAPIRLFTLGIGNGVSHALIEGVAKAGNGFSQTVAQGEKMDTKVVRMLKGALSPHINDYTLEVKYSKDNTTAVDDDDDFEIVEKVADSLKVKLDLKEEKQEKSKKPISLFDTSADPDKEEPPAYDETGEGQYSHLPKIATPKIIQAPQNIPSLFAFNRTTVYLLLGPEAPAATPKSVILRGTSGHGPLELEIPIQILDQPGETIHQLAAKKAISELEQGRGWLPEAKDENGKFIKIKFEGRFSDMVEREAVRLGVQFQVGGKWCSFVAVESNKKNRQEQEKNIEDWEFLEDEIPAVSAAAEMGQAAMVEHFRKQQQASLQHPNAQGSRPVTRRQFLFGNPSRKSFGSAPQPKAAKSSSIIGPDGTSSSATFKPTDLFGASNMSKPATPAELFGTVNTSNPPAGRMGMLGGHGGGALFGAQPRSAQHYAAPSPRSGGLFGARPGVAIQQREAPAPSPQSGGLFGTTSSAGIQQQQSFASQSLFGSISEPTGELKRKSQGQVFGATSDTIPLPPPPPAPSAAQSTSGSDALHDYQMQHMVLEQQNKKRLMMARQEQDDMNTGPMNAPLPPQHLPQAPSAPPASHDAQVLRDYQMSLMTLRQENKNRLKTERLSNENKILTPPAPASFGAAPHSNQSSSPPFADTQTVDMVFGNEGALENFDFDSFLQEDDSGAAFELGEEFRFSNPENNKNYGSTQTKLARGTADMSFGGGGGAKGVVTTEEFTPPSPHFSPTSPGYSPASPSSKNGNRVPSPGFMTGSAAPTGSSPSAPIGSSGFRVSSSVPPYTAAGTLEDLTNILISHQTFEGSWEKSLNVLGPLQISEATIGAESQKVGVNEKVLVTALVVAAFETKLRAFEGSWELLVEKARSWLEEQVEDVEALVTRAGALIK